VPFRFFPGVLLLLIPVSLFAQEASSVPAPEPAAEEEAAPEEPVDAAVQNRTTLNLLGAANTERGESRRNENVQITLIDNNATRELNTRIGTSATIVEEFLPDRNYFSAEIGNNPRSGFQVAAQNGSGVHGQLFWTHQNSLTTARSYFQVGSVQPARSNQYGINLTAPLWKDGYFSTSLSQNKNRGQVNGNILIPLPSERTPLTADPATRILIERFFSAYPNVAPNRPDIADRALNTNSPQSIDTDTHSGQITQKLSDKDTITARYAFTGQQVTAFQFVTGQNPNTTTKSHNAATTWHHVLTPQTVLAVTAAFERTTTNITTAAGAVGPISVQGLTQLGPPFDAPRWRVQNRYRIGASAQSKRGSHTISLGWAATRLQYNSDEQEVSRGLYQFNPDFGRDGITNLRLGTASRYFQSIGTAYRALRNWDMQAYIGDHWQATGNLTLNAALRWEPLSKPFDATGLARIPFGGDWNNFAPSAGFAYRLPRRWGVLRGAGAVAFGQIFPVTFGIDRYNTPHNSRVIVQAPVLGRPLEGVDTNPANLRSSRFLLSPNMATPYSYQYNFSWEGELSRNWRMTLGYVGSRTHKLFYSFLLNRAVPVPGIPFTTATVGDRRADKTAFEILDIHNGSRAFYDAAIATISTPRWNGLSLTGSYWLSKSIDFGTDYTFVGIGSGSREASGQSGVDPRKDQKALSDFDQPHAALLQASYDTGRRGSGWWSALTSSWTIASVYLLKSGTPITIVAGSDGPGFGNVDGLQGDRPFILDPTILGRTIGDPDTSPQLLPRSAFRFMNAPQEMAGDLGRNVFRKGKIANVNASIQRAFAVRDWAVTIRAESVNFFNTPQFAGPGDNLASPNFGQITNTLNDGRTVRFTLRLAF
jgi:hypothetical protein